MGDFNFEREIRRESPKWESPTENGRVGTYRSESQFMIFAIFILSDTKIAIYITNFDSVKNVRSLGN